MPLKTEKLSLVDNGVNIENEVKKDANDGDVAGGGDAGNEESNGVGDKIKKFEKAAEDASVPPGRLSRPGSVRGRGRTERLGSDPKEDLPPPATPFKDNVHFELGSATLGRQQSLSKNSPPLPKWPRDQPAEPIKKTEPQKIIKPEFKPMPSPVDVTIRSPSLGVKIADQFPSHGTAFRNVASPAPAPAPEADVARAVHKFEDAALNNSKPCKSKPKEKSYQISKGSSYFTRGSEEIWLVKKKDIEEIEERVLDSFRRAGGNVCVRSESLRPASDGGHAHGGFSHATMGRKRQMYARSESLDPQWAGARAQTLKRQTSVACTCGHDKKTRAKSAGAAAAAAAAAEQPPRPRSRSHGDDNNQAHVLDKYETLV
ncbi:uncharacterized protein LOC134797544 [Cydia splendana]|uniref:uncharacterized protein LOC134797544 n=1 Tax=Cydia splendana TaxID=1100963 RepID=UPI0021222824